MWGKVVYFWRSWLFQHLFTIELMVVWLFALSVLSFQLRELPAESWADVVENQRLAQQVYRGEFFWKYKFGGDGPVLPHLAGVLGWWQGEVTYQTMKLTTALVGSTLPVAVMLCMTELIRQVVMALKHSSQLRTNRFTLAITNSLQRYQQVSVVWVGLISATWFWPVVLSRQGKPYSLAMVFVAWLIWFVLKKSWWRVGVFLALSSFTQMSAIGSWVIVGLLQPLTLLVALPLSLPLFNQWVVERTLTSEFSHFGQKLGWAMSIPDRLEVYARNLWLNFQSLWWRGDPVIYQNIPKTGHLDCLSGLLVIGGIILVGVVIWSRPKLWRTAGVLLWGLVVLQVPAMLDVFVSNTPNAGRLAVWVPLLACLAGFGMLLLTTLVQMCGQGWKYVQGFILGCWLVGGLLIVGQNMYEYFVVYRLILPSHNQQVSLRIVDFLQSHLYGKTVLVHNCCWHQSSQPQPWIIGLEVTPERRFVQINDQADVDNWLHHQCRVTRDAFLVLNPDLSTLPAWQGKIKLEPMTVPHLDGFGPVAAIYYLP